MLYCTSKYLLLPQEVYAKCVVIDRERVLVTSANFTEATHQRNIEVGILIVDQAIADAITNQFNFLVEMGNLRPIAV